MNDQDMLNLMLRTWWFFGAAFGLTAGFIIAFTTWCFGVWSIR